MNEINFILFFFILALGIPTGYGLTYLIAWLVVDYQDRNEKMRRRMGYSDYLRYRRKKRRKLLFFIGLNVILILPTMIVLYYEAFKTVP